MKNNYKFKQYFFKYYLLVCFFLIFLLMYQLVFYSRSNGNLFRKFLNDEIELNKCVALQNNNPSFVVYQDMIVNNDNNEVLPFFFSSLPSFEGKNKSYDNNYSRSIFIKSLIPIILQINNDIILERQELLRIKDLMIFSPLIDEDLKFIDYLSVKYKVFLTDYNFWDYAAAVDQLLDRVDTLPISLILAIIAVDTNWGNNDLLIKNNALFFIREYSKEQDQFYIPLRANRHFNQYSSIESSIIRWYKELNSSSKYKYIRDIRKRADKSNQVLLAQRIAQTMDNKKYLNNNVSLLKFFREYNFQNYEKNYIFSDRYQRVCIDIV